MLWFFISSGHSFHFRGLEMAYLFQHDENLVSALVLSAY